MLEQRAGEKAGLRVYANDADRAVDTRLAFGYDRGSGVAVCTAGGVIEGGIVSVGSNKAVIVKFGVGMAKGV